MNIPTYIDEIMWVNIYHKPAQITMFIGGMVSYHSQENGWFMTLFYPQ